MHPLIVHFPVAFLSVYSLFEILRLTRRFSSPTWFPVRATLVLIGTTGALAALISGGFAEERIMSEGKQILQNAVEVHSMFATLAALCYFLMALGYGITLLELSGRLPVTGQALLRRISHRLLGTPVAYVLAAIGFVLIMVTGALGANVVFGADADPIVRAVAGLLVK